ncbi:MAG: ATPase domain-containing protein, partial [Myxococcota bacterium]
RIYACVEDVKFMRVFIDPLTQLRTLSTSAHHFRRQALAFLNFLHARGITALFSSEMQEEEADAYLQVIADGVFDLSKHADRRVFEVMKFRGSDFREGPHSLRLTAEGMKVFPRLTPEDYGIEFRADHLSSGIPELDEVLGGGIERGTVTLITGPAGVGKTTLGIQFMKEAAGRGEHSVVYSFEEQAEILLCRCEALNIPARTMMDKGTLSLRRVEPLGMSADEFAQDVRREVEERKAKIVMIDSIAGYRLTLQGGDLVQHLHALCKYLQNMGVAVLLINEVEGISGDFRVTDFQISYLSDNVVFIRYMERHTETGVELRKVLGVLKKRLTAFDQAVHELEFSRFGLKVGARLSGVTSILSQMPIWRPGQR